MLNISDRSIHKDVNIQDYQSGILVTNSRHYKLFGRLSLLFLLILVLVLFLPWTQNINGKGYVTALRPDQRPQFIESPIAGRIEKWFVMEGDFVHQGDTILKISEVKSDYFDNDLVSRTKKQILAKEESVNVYEQKIAALGDQIQALKKEKELKIEQAQNKLRQAAIKVQSDSMNLSAAQANIIIFETQYQRTLELQKDGLKAVKDVEEKKQKLQTSEAKVLTLENKFLESKNKVNNASIELTRIEAQYADKIAKSKSDLYSARSNQLNADVEVSKLKNKYSNYSRRDQLKYIKAPQSGYINKTIKNGIGEIFKAGESLVKIMPSDYQLAVETYVKPADLPLIHTGEKVRVQFDGWPAIVFSGWENVSYGTFGGHIVAIENFISDNRMYRVLIAPDEDDHQWPKVLGIGSGAKTIILLNDVPIWYEMWRRLNGFPPNFYKPSKDKPVKKTKIKIKK